MRTITHLKNDSLLKALFLGVFTILGCDNADEQSAVKPNVTLVDKVSHALTPSTVRAIQGVYGAGCLGRAGTWEIPLNGYSSTNPTLSVIKGNASCALTVTSVLAGPNASPISYGMASTFPLVASFAPQATAFATGGTGPTDFYANFRIQPDMNFSSDFTIEMVYSDDASQVSAGATATFVVQSSSATASAVPPSDYSIDLSGIGIQVDAGYVVQAASGSAQLSNGATAGDSYVVDTQNALPASPTFADLDDAYLLGTPQSITGANPAIPVAALDLIGRDLSTPLVRNIIVAHTISGTRAYQLFRLTFNHP
jgi:hypothetical protein